MDFRTEEPLASGDRMASVVAEGGRGGGSGWGGIVGVSWGAVWVTLYDDMIAVDNDGVPDAGMN
jgi:hypothetical protein